MPALEDAPDAMRREGTSRGYLGEGTSREDTFASLYLLAARRPPPITLHPKLTSARAGAMAMTCAKCALHSSRAGLTAAVHAVVVTGMDRKALCVHARRGQHDLNFSKSHTLHKTSTSEQQRATAA